MSVTSVIYTIVFLLVKHAIKKQTESVAVKLTCGNENQDNKYVVQKTIRHHCVDEVSLKCCKTYLLSVDSIITGKKRKFHYNYASS